jgi:hypothetical protein
LIYQERGSCVARGLSGYFFDRHFKTGVSPDLERRVSEIPRYGNVGSFNKRGMMMRKTFFAVIAATVCLAGYSNGNGGIPNTFEKPSIDALKALKATVGKPFSAGYVFVDGHYINPPYTVQRYGTVIRINGILLVHKNQIRVNLLFANITLITCSKTSHRCK